MTYQNVWWHTPHEYGEGLNPGQTWPGVYEQYRRPTDQRVYDIPVEPYHSKLYYEHPTMGMPKYRATFRDRPHCVPSTYPNGTDGKPVGFHGRVYHEQCGPTRYGYNGPQKDDLYYLERPPYNPAFPRTKATAVGKEYRVFEGMNLPQCPKTSTLDLTYSMKRSNGQTGTASSGAADYTKYKS